MNRIILSLFIGIAALVVVNANAASNKASAGVFPQEGSFGLGALIGTMGSVETKYFATPTDAFDAAIEFMDRPWAVIYGNYIRHFPAAFSRATSAYLGAGVGAGFWYRQDKCGRWKCSWNPKSTGSGNGFFGRVVAGVEWYPGRRPLAVLAEVAPSWMWYPTNGSTTDVVAGARYYF